MASLSLVRTIESNHLQIPELGDFLGKQVEITIREMEPPPNDRWQALLAVGGKDRVDPEAYRSQRKQEPQWAMERTHDSD